MSIPEAESSERPLRLSMVLPVLIPWAVVLGIAVAGIDFGEHFDEHYMIESVERTIDREVLLPGFYNYPSMLYSLCLAALLPDATATLAQNPGLGRERIDALKPIALEKIHTKGYTLRARVVSAFVSSLAVVWVYLLVLVWRRKWGEALLAAGLMASSWEVGYHLRYIAVDAVMMQFGALVMLLVVAYLRYPAQRWLLWAAAIAAGFATSTKYPGGLLILPVLAADAMTWSGRGDWAKRATRLVLLGVTFAAAYLVITPGTVLEPIKFIGNVSYEFKHYKGGHFGHTVAPGPQHFMKILRYDTLDMLSPYKAIASAFFVLSVAGAICALRKTPKIAALYIALPVLYTLYFTMQRVMFVRNLTLAAPFLAVCAAMGVGALWAMWSNKVWRGALAAACSAAVIASVVWQAEAVSTIRDRNTVRFLRDALAYADAHPNERIFTPAITHERLAAVRASLPSNLVTDTASATQALFIWTDGFPDGWQTFPANIPRDVVAWFGPKATNFPYATAWPEEMIVVTPIAWAREHGVRGITP
ncbi:MAG: phospholipid carrier-dependent glycosyltransferase [Candidatus Hydrogenedentes bacterium]|nr:phospholipid carrier-dependent glycosyltransferase [Candidatus Hydrogenedentota bacterium]